MAYILIRAINWFAQILVCLLMARAILSWFPQNPYSTLGKINQVIIRITEMVVAPCRAFLSRLNTGMFDFSVLLAFILVEVVARILTYIIAIIAF